MAATTSPSGSVCVFARLPNIVAPIVSFDVATDGRFFTTMPLSDGRRDSYELLVSMYGSPSATEKWTDNGPQPASHQLSQPSSYDWPIGENNDPTATETPSSTIHGGECKISQVATRSLYFSCGAGQDGSRDPAQAENDACGVGGGCAQQVGSGGHGGGVQRVLPELRRSASASVPTYNTR